MGDNLLLRGSPQPKRRVSPRTGNARGVCYEGLCSRRGRAQLKRRKSANRQSLKRKRKRVRPALRFCGFELNDMKCYKKKRSRVNT